MDRDTTVVAVDRVREGHNVMKAMKDTLHCRSSLHYEGILKATILSE